MWLLPALLPALPAAIPPWPLRGGDPYFFNLTACELKWRRYSTLKGASAWFSAPGSGDPTVPVGVDLGSAEEGLRNHFASLTREDAEKYTSSDGWLKVGECEVDTPEGRWYTVRVGPFVSTGGYDWWNFFYEDVGNMQPVLDSLKPGETLAVTGHASATVSADGQPLPFPPIHHHHVHVTPGTFLDPRVLDWTGKDLHGYRNCVLHGKDCYNLEAFMNDHGDYQLITHGESQPDLGHWHSYPKFSRQFYSPLTMLGQLNDVRPMNSPKLEWYYQFSMRIVVDRAGETDRLAVSNHAVQQPFNAVLEKNQPISSIWVPTDADSFHFAAGKWPIFDGVIIGVDWHEHSLKWQESLLCLGSPQQLGLGQGKFLATPPQRPILTATTGFKDNKALHEHFMRLLSVEGAPANKRPRLICSGQVNVQQVGGAFYDRLATSNCTPTHIYAGEAWTLIGMNGDPWNVHTTGSTQGFSMSQANGAFYEHNYAWIYYIASDGKSHYSSYSRGVSYIDEYAKGVDDRRDLILEALHNGSDNEVTFVDELLVNVLLFMFWVQNLFAGDLAVPGLVWVAALFVSFIVLVGSSARSGAACWKVVGAAFVSAVGFLTLSIAIVALSTPPSVYFVNLIEQQRLSVHDAEVAAVQQSRSLLPLMTKLCTFVPAGMIIAAAVITLIARPSTSRKTPNGKALV